MSSSGHSATGIGFTNDFARRLRGWTSEQWDAGVDGLRVRGLLDEAGALMPLGNELRSRIEDLTDDLAYPPLRTISDDDAAELSRLTKVVREAVLASGFLPAAGSGARYGAHR
jgi:helix-turn-helix protein